MNEIIMTGKTVDEAIDKACEELKIERSEAQFEIIEEPKKGVFSKKEATVKVWFESLDEAKTQISKEYVEIVLSALNYNDAVVKTEATERGIAISIEGDDLNLLVGRHGETLDALQYLTSLKANRIGGSFLRVTVNTGDFRKKRKQTLIDLAHKTAQKVREGGRKQTLEPMNAYERRIIHFEISQMEGLSSTSIGEEPRRKVVILNDIPPRKSDYNKKSDRSSREPRNNNVSERDEKALTKADNISSQPDTYNFDAEFKKSVQTKEKEAKLYSKIEF